VAANEALGGAGKMLLGSDATEAEFKSQPLGDFQIIHIAAHGIANPQFPDRTALVLGAGPQSQEDGLLQVREIRNFTLHADLVTLSGCETDLGHLEGEDGVANLVRAFLLSGARSVLASLWGASDIYTENLMRHFYRHLGENQDPGQALRRAKLDLIQEFGDEAMPALWAGFVIIGDGTRFQQHSIH
jgi:CHAT domain-containing protein